MRGVVEGALWRVFIFGLRLSCVVFSVEELAEEKEVVGSLN